MEILLCPDAQIAARSAADLMTEALLGATAPCLGLATGGTMLPVYADLVARGDDWSAALTFNLDEYVGLSSDHPASYHTYMDKLLFRQLARRPRASYLPRGDSPDPGQEADTYEALIARSGGIDLQLLGIGRNGHIGFNEPGSPLSSRTRVVTLTDSTKEANARFFGPGENQPSEAISMGIATILEARACVLLATGMAKAQAIARLVNGPAGLDCPATALRDHGAVTVILDAEAAALL